MSDCLDVALVWDEKTFVRVFSKISNMAKEDNEQKRVWKTSGNES